MAKEITVAMHKSCSLSTLFSTSGKAPGRPYVPAVAGIHTPTPVASDTAVGHDSEVKDDNGGT